MNNKPPKLLDCTLRDGGYINEWDFSKQFAHALYRAVSNSGCDYMEAGFLGESGDKGLPWTNLTNQDLLDLKSSYPNGSRIAVMINYGKIKIEDVPPAKDFSADMIRVAAAKNVAKEAAKFAAALSSLGYETTVNFMGISNYSNEEILGLVDLINQYKGQISYFYVADSFGSLLPSRTHEIFRTLRFGTKAPLGFHPHNNLQLAFANCLEAIEAGVNIIDGSVFGMGRGGGNLFTDAMLAYFEKKFPESYGLLPVLQFADLYMEDMKSRYSWGYSLPQLMTGMLSCHPNYPTKLLRRKAYTADMIHGMLHELNGSEKQSFSTDVMVELEHKNYEKVAGNTPVAINQEMEKMCHESHQKALLLGGGRSVMDFADDIKNYIKKENLTCFSINNPTTPVTINGVFFCNRRRILKHHEELTKNHQVVLGPDIHKEAPEEFALSKISWINPLKLIQQCQSEEKDFVPSNSAVESILGLVQMGYKTIYIAGMDGYKLHESNYYRETDGVVHERHLSLENAEIENELEHLSHLQEKLNFTFSIVTPTIFEKFYQKEIIK